MKLLKCKICKGDVDLIGNGHAINRKVKCDKCNNTERHSKSPEVFVIRKKS